MSRKYQDHINRALELIHVEIKTKDKEIMKLKQELKELEDKYSKLLVFGVSVNNEKLKGL